MRALSLASEYTITDDRKNIIREQASLLVSSANETLATDYEKQEVRTLYDALKTGWA